MKGSMDAKTTQKVLLNSNHKNIFFIKDQLFDKERVKQIVNNKTAQNCLVTNDDHAVRVPITNVKKITELNGEIKSEKVQLEEQQQAELVVYRILPSFKESVLFGI